MTPVRLGTIVEGHGEVDAVPLLLRRIALSARPSVPFETARPVRVHRGSLIREGGIEKAVEFALKQAKQGGVLVVVDADEDCPATLGPALLARAINRWPRTSVVLANREFESWFLASSTSLAGRRGLSSPLEPPQAIETIRDAKGWLAARMVDPFVTYSETLDQAALTAVFDMDLAREKSDSFRKMWQETLSLIDQVQHNQ